MTPFFIVGTGRSGTTMFRKLLAHHPAVHVPRETHFLPLLYEAFASRAAPARDIFDFIEQVFMAKGETILERIHRNQDLDAATFRSAVLAPFDGGAATCTIRQFMQRFYQVLGEDRGASIIGDKTPDYGLCMGMIHSIWPAAKFIHIARDGRDVAISMSKVLSFRILAASGIDAWWALAWQKGYARWLEAANGVIPIDQFFQLWLRRLRRTRAEAAQLAPGSCLEIRYEDILRDPAAMLAAAHAFLNLPAPASWIDTAAAAVRGGNLNRNRELPEYRELTARFAEELWGAGFSV